jgi:hypothetical protein
LVSARLAFGVRRNALSEVGDDVGGRRQLVGGENAFHARRGERSTRVDAHHAAVRNRTEQQLAEQHAVDAEVFGVLAFPVTLATRSGVT